MSFTPSMNLDYEPPWIGFISIVAMLLIAVYCVVLMINDSENIIESTVEIEMVRING